LFQHVKKSLHVSKKYIWISENKSKLNLQRKKTSWSRVIVCTLDKGNLNNFNFNWKYSQTCLQRPPLGPQKSGRCTELAGLNRFFNQNWY